MTRYVLGFNFSRIDGALHVALIKKNRGPVGMAGKLNGLGGRVASGEAPADAMCRKFRIEAGVSTSEDYWVPFATMSGLGWECACFWMVSDRPEARTMTDESVGWYPVQALPDGWVMPNLRWLIPLACDEEHPGSIVDYSMGVTTRPHALLGQAAREDGRMWLFARRCVQAGYDLYADQATRGEPQEYERISAEIDAKAAHLEKRYWPVGTSAPRGTRSTERALVEATEHHPAIYRDGQRLTTSEPCPLSTEVDP